MNPPIIKNKQIKKMAKQLISKFTFLDKYVNTNKFFTLLDVGAGNYSATHTKAHFPNCTYHGLDLNRDYNNSEEDFKKMDAFYEMDLTKLEFEAIPNDYYDVIIISHVIEHLHNGTDVLEHITSKLKQGGFIYVEYPSFRSTKLPSRKGTLNFFDDDTHCRLYSQIELYNTFLKSDCIPIKGGTHRRWKNILLTPIKIVHNKIKYGHVMTSVFWDVFGFAEYVIAKKK